MRHGGGLAFGTFALSAAPYDDRLETCMFGFDFSSGSDDGTSTTSSRLYATVGEKVVDIHAREYTNAYKPDENTKSVTGTWTGFREILDAYTCALDAAAALEKLADSDAFGAALPQAVLNDLGDRVLEKACADEEAGEAAAATGEAA